LVREDHRAVRGGVRRPAPRRDGGGGLAPLLPPRLPGGSVHLPLPGRARPPGALPADRAARRRRRGVHHLAVPARLDGATDDRRQDRHRRVGGRQVPVAAGGAQPGVPRPPAAAHVPGPPLGAPGAAGEADREDAIPVPELKAAFSRFLSAAPNRLHAAAHSHHPWPDVTFEAHLRAWEHAAELADDKWDRVFEVLIPSVRRKVAAVLGLPDPATLTFAPNTHEFVVRIAADLPRPFRVLTTDSEFHSFARQLSRWEEAGVAVADRVPAEPFETFPERFVSAYRDPELGFFRPVHCDSGSVARGLAAVVLAFPAEPLVVVDGYHGFMALPTDLGPIADRAFYVAGGYKYAMSGEGACFLHVPPSAPARPVDTGWFAGFGALTETPTAVAYSPGGQRYAGATFDPSGLYRMDAVLGWLEEAGITVAEIHRHVSDLQERLLGLVDPALAASLIPGRDAPERGHFLTFRLAEARDLYERLHARGVITDYPGDRWRVGLGMYHDEDDVNRLAKEIHAVRRPPSHPMDLIDVAGRLAAGTALAAVLGVEREAAGKAAGLRTYAMVGLGSAVFTVVSMEAFDTADRSRVAAQI